MAQLATVISMEEIDTADRLGYVGRAAENAVAQLQAQFPEADGYRYKVTNRAPQPSAFCRDIRVRRGLNCGMYVVIQGTGQKMSGVKLTVGRESTITTVLGIAGFLGGFGAPFGYAGFSGLFSGPHVDMTNVYGLMAGGLILGGGSGEGSSVHLATAAGTKGGGG
jgi:hypothetical protein